VAGNGTPLSMLLPNDRSASATLNVAPNDKRKILKIEKVRAIPDATYRIFVYVHPEDVKLSSLPTISGGVISRARSPSGSRPTNIIPTSDAGRHFECFEAGRAK
jgi:hypothetical protein